MKKNMIIEDKSHVIIEKNNGVMTLTINWPQEHNAMDWQTHRGIAKAYRMAENDEDVKVLVVKGTDGYFNTGGKCNHNDPKEKAEYNSSLEEMTAAQIAISTPVIAAVNGHCLAGGMMIVARATFAIALENVEFGFPEIKSGAFPMVVMSPMVDIVPKKKFMHMIISGENFSAKEAKKAGFLTEVAKSEDFDSTIKKYVDMIIPIDRDVMRIGVRCYKDMCKCSEEIDRIQVGMKNLQDVWAARNAANIKKEAR